MGSTERTDARSVSEQSQRLFVLHGNGPLLNRGCEAILRSTISILNKQFGPCRYVNAPPAWMPFEYCNAEDLSVVQTIPYKVGGRWSPSWFKFQLQKRLLGGRPMPFEKYLSKASATLALGGDNYSLDYGVPTEYFRMNNMTLSRGKPLVIWGASIGPFSRNREFEKLAREELKKVTMICARESETIDYLASIGVSDNVRAVSDPAFILEVEPAELASCEKEILKGKCIGLNLSPLMARYWQGDDSWLERATACIEAILQAVDCPVVLLPHVTCPSNDDHEFMARCKEGLTSYDDRLILIEPRFSTQQLKWIISNFDVFIGARTHATIAALSTFVPTLSIGYSIKSRGINKDIFGHCDYVIPLDRLQPDALAQSLVALLGDAQNVRTHLSEIMPQYKQKAWNAGKLVAELLEA